MHLKSGLRKPAITLAGILALAMIWLPTYLGAFTFTSGRQFPHRSSFIVSSSNFPVAAGDTIADHVLGQMDFVHATQNFADASTLDLQRSIAGLAIDQSSVPNRIYVADFTNNRVLGWASAAALSNGKPANIVIGQPDFFSTICNNGGVSASSLCGPVAVAVDGSGNLYVSDSRNSRVLEYNTPFVNTGEPGSGDRIADQVFGQQEDFTASFCDQGAGMGATSGTLCFPGGVAIDSAGVLYVADQGNDRALEFLFPSIDTTPNDVFGQGGQFTTTDCNKGGSISANGLCSPMGVATDSSNNLYVADSGNSRVLEYDNPPLNDTTADRVFGQNGSFKSGSCNLSGAVAGAKTLCSPTGVALDAAGHLYVADRNNSRVLEYTTPAASTTANKVFGQDGSMAGRSCNFSGVTDAVGLCRPGGVALDSYGNLFVADDQNNRVLEYFSAFSGDTTADAVLGQPDFEHSDPNVVDASSFGGSAADVIPAGTLDIAALGAVAIDSSVSPPRLYVADNHNNRVLGFNNATSLTNGEPADIVIGQTSLTNGSSHACNDAPSSFNLCSPIGVAVDGQGNLYVADEQDNRVLKFQAPVTTGEGAALVIGQSDFTSTKCNAGLAAPTSATLCAPWSLAVDGTGTLYVADLVNNRVLAYSKPKVSHPNAVQVFGQPSPTTGQCNNGGVSAASLCEPTGVGVDSIGRLFIADFNNSRVLRFTTPLTFPSADVVVGQDTTGSNFTSSNCNSGGIGAAFLCNPSGVAIDANNNLYIADAGNNRILHYNANRGTVSADIVFGQGGFFSTTLANLGGTAPDAATLSLPLWLAVDSPGNLYAADAGNNRVLQYEAPVGVPSPTPTPGSITVSPTSLNFGNVAAGNISMVKKVVLTNAGAGPITVNAISRVGSNPTDFPQYNNCIGSLAGGKSCTIHISFAPSAPAGTSEAAELVVHDNAKNAPQFVPIYGSSALPVTLAPASLNFGKVAVGTTSAAKDLTLSNNQSSAITISGISLGGTNPGDFLKSTTCGASLAAFKSCAVSAKFKPAASGPRSAVLKITDSPDTGSPHDAGLTGSGT